MRSIRSPLFIMLAITSLILVACSSGNRSVTPGSTSSADPIKVVTATAQIADMVKNIGGNRVEVTSLMGPGIDPHLYQASAGDVNLLSSANIIFYNGLHLEAQMGKVFEQMAGRGIITIAITEQITEDLLISTPNFGASHDPHVWFDVSLWMKGIPVVREALSERDPAGADLYRANAEQYEKELDALHQYVLSEANRIPLQKRVLITAHDAFGYFGRAYGFEVRGLQGISTESEASTRDVQQLADFIARNEIPAVFVESSVPQRNIEAVQAAVKSRGYNTVIGGQLYSDAMGDPGTPEGTYIGMVKYNINTIVKALLGE